jgi:hypothetical protein
VSRWRAFAAGAGKAWWATVSGGLWGVLDCVGNVTINLGSLVEISAERDKNDPGSGAAWAISLM